MPKNISKPYFLFVYDAQTGQLKSAVHDPIPENYEDWIATQEVAWDRAAGMQPADNFYTHWYFDIAAQELKERPQFDAQDGYVIQANGVDEVQIGIPEGTIVTIDGEVIDIPDYGNGLLITSTEEAEFDIVLEKWPYVTKYIKVNVV